MERMNLSQILDQMDSKAEGDKLTFGAILDGLGGRGYGPLILAAALVELMPTGGIPGIPTLVAITVIIFASQLAIGRRTPWIPERLKNKGFARRKFEKGRDKLKKVTTKLDRVIKPRLHFFVTPFAARIVGAVCIVLALCMPPMEIMPFLSYIPAAAIALLAVGLTGQDGLIVLLGLIVALTGLLAGIYWLIL